jgi:hypothetical protein
MKSLPLHGVLVAFALVLMSSLPTQAQEPPPQQPASPEPTSSEPTGPEAASSEPAGPEAALGTAFSYQGQLKKSGQLVSGACSMAFRLYNAASAGSQVGVPVTLTTVPITGGLFTVGLDFGGSAFAGERRWLETRVMCSGDANYVTLAPRQEVLAAPYALYSMSTGALRGRALMDAAPSSGQALMWNGGAWSPAAVPLLGRAVAPTAGTATTVDNVAYAGAYSSMTIGTDGLPVVSYYCYYDQLNADLKVLHCGNAACSSANTVISVDSVANLVGGWTSITIGADGLPVISYQDVTNDNLKVLHCGNTTCSSGNMSNTVDAGSASDTSITIGTDGLPVISYYDVLANDLKVLHCGNTTCGNGNTRTTVDHVVHVGRIDTSITIGTDGLPVISYCDALNADLKVLHCGNADCGSGNTRTTVDSVASVGAFSSVTIGADGLPVISYYDSTNGDVKVLHCGNKACSSGNISTTVDSNGDVGQHTSITIGTDGLPVVSYYDVTNTDLKVLHCGNATCASGNTARIVDAGGDLGMYTSITIGADGLPVVSYQDVTNGDLKVLHCSNAFCTPYFRRR